MEVKERIESIVGSVGEVRVDRGKRIVEVKEPKKITEVAEKLKAEGFDHVKSVSGVDYSDQGYFEIVYHVSSYSTSELAKTILVLKVRVPSDNPRSPSLIKIWPSVEMMERETYEMYGIIFEGHPELKRLFLPEEFEGVYPLRKSFKIKEEGIMA